METRAESVVVNLSARREGASRKAGPKVAREAYFLYVDRATEGANAADGPLSWRWLDT
jgi:hypothetical protein